VLCDVGTLASLTEREYRSGLAEVIKHGAIADARFFAWLEEHIDALAARSPDTCWVSFPTSAFQTTRSAFTFTPTILSACAA